MSQSWREILDELEITTVTGAGPAGDGGEWHQLLAAFGTHGFMRALTDGDQLALECVPPGDAAAARQALSRAGWVIDGDSSPFVAHRDFPADAPQMRQIWILIARLGDAIRGDDAVAFTDALKADAPAPEQTTESPEVPAETASGSAFEAIGDEPGREPMTGSGFAFSLVASGGAVDGILGFGATLDPEAYGELERRIVRNLRGKYDVDVKIVGAHEVAGRLAQEPKTRVAIRVTPDEVMGQMSLSDIESAIGGYFETLAELAGSGIDPLVFLGVRASTRQSGAFEAIGATAASTTPAPALVVDDDEDEDDEEPGAQEVVFSGASMPAPEDPLQAGRYDDPRLKRPDATTALVDVVLRHPGYSDRNMGQVLSILLSLDYASCLDIAARAPTAIAWGVARDRAQTMKTVIEGAGGKVILVEPGTFGEG